MPGTKGLHRSNNLAGAIKSACNLGGNWRKRHHVYCRRSKTGTLKGILLAVGPGVQVGAETKRLAFAANVTAVYAASIQMVLPPVGILLTTNAIALGFAVFDALQARWVSVINGIVVHVPIEVLVCLYRVLAQPAAHRRGVPAVEVVLQAGVGVKRPGGKEEERVQAPPANAGGSGVDVTLSSVS